MTSALSDKDREMIFFSYFGNFCLVLILFLTLPSCTSSSGLKQEDKGRFLRAEATESGKQTKQSERNEKLFLGPSADRTTSSQDYRIGPEDLLEITVFEDEKLNKTVRVSSQGNIGFPLLGAVRVKGLTVSELEREIQGLLAEKYIQNPNVSVFIKEYRNQRIAVLGMVEKPGIFDVTGQKTVLDMLALAGGLKEDAGPLLFLIHSSQAAEGQEKDKDSSRQGFETLVIHLDELLVRGDLNRNAFVSHRDVINIPASGKVFVGGAVVKPGGFPLKGKKLTVSASHRPCRRPETREQWFGGADLPLFGKRRRKRGHSGRCPDDPRRFSRGSLSARRRYADCPHESYEKFSDRISGQPQRILFLGFMV